MNARRMAALVAVVLVAMAGTAQSATVYLCRAYSGATFWASTHCNQHQALIERIEQVADVPWDQQVQQAEQGSSARARQAQASSQDNQTAMRCARLIAERNQIESRYTNWQWQPPEVINPDQQRMRALRGELAANRCWSQ